MPLGHREFWVYGDIQIGVEPVAQSADARFTDFFHARGLPSRLFDLVNHPRVHSVEQPGEHRLCESHTILKITRVMSNPTRGSASG